jgi:hypothetical protein
MIKIVIKVDKADLIAKLELFSQQMKVGLLPAWQRIADRMYLDQIVMAPLRTGVLISNIETNAYVMGVKSKSDAIDPRNGYNYARIQHDGGYIPAGQGGWAGEHYIRGKFYMTIPLGRTESYNDTELSQEIKKIIARCGLS